MHAAYANGLRNDHLPLLDFALGWLLHAHDLVAVEDVERVECSLDL